MKYDVTLKQLVTRSAPRLLSALVEGPIVEWLNVEMPRVGALRMDLLCRRADGCLVNIEFQTQNEPEMARRVAVYYLEAFRVLGSYPMPVVLYLGKDRMSMPDRIDTAHMQFRMRLIDIREFDGDDLAEHGELGDAIISILARVKDRRKAVVRVLERISKLKGRARSVAAQQLTILAGLRGMEAEVVKEANRMPVIIDLMENKVVREIYERGAAEGIEKGIAKGLEKGLAKGKAAGLSEGRLAGERALLVRQLEKRFGKLPARALRKIETAKLAKLETWGLRLLDAESLDAVLS